MAAHRYWRAVAMEAYGAGDLELSALHLLSAGVRVDAAATLTASVAPDVSGALADLQDSDLSASARWSSWAVKRLALQWDFSGSPADVKNIQIAGDIPSRFLLIVKIQWSDDAAVWVDFKTVAGITWPGVLTKTTAVSYNQTLWSKSDRDVANTALSADGKTLTVWNLCSGRGANGRTTGRQQFEVRLKPSSGLVCTVGVARKTGLLTGYPGGDADSFGYYPANGNKYNNSTGAPYGATSGLSDVLGVVVDFATGTLVFYKNGVSQGVAFSGLSGELFPVFGSSTGTSVEMIAEMLSPLVYPVYGATAWGDTPPEIPTNEVKGRAALGAISTLGTGPAIVYGIPSLVIPTRLSVESGAVKDYTSGVLGQGIGRVRGTVKLKGSPFNTPLKRRVRLIRERDGLQVREVWSDPATGEYDFTYVDELQVWSVVSYDHTHDKRAVIADNLTLENGGVEVMP